MFLIPKMENPLSQALRILRHTQSVRFFFALTRTYARVMLLMIIGRGASMNHTSTTGSRSLVVPTRELKESHRAVFENDDASARDVDLRSHEVMTRVFASIMESLYGREWR